MVVQSIQFRLYFLDNHHSMPIMMKKTGTAIPIGLSCIPPFYRNIEPIDVALVLFIDLGPIQP